MPRFPKVIIQLIPDPKLGGFTAFIPDLPAIGEGKTRKEAIADLKESIQLYVDEFGLQEALSRIVGISNTQEMNFGELVSHG